MIYALRRMKFGRDGVGFHRMNSLAFINGKASSESDVTSGPSRDRRTGSVVLVTRLWPQIPAGGKVAGKRSFRRLSGYCGKVSLPIAQGRAEWCYCCAKSWAIVRPKVRGYKARSPFSPRISDFSLLTASLLTSS
jgi:hypothetical protein